MFNLLKNITKLTTNVIVTPLAIIKDSINFVDIIDEDKKSETVKKSKDIIKNLNDIIENK